MLNEYGRNNDWLDINEPRIHKQLFDEFGNRFNELVVEEYYRNCNREWIKDISYNSSINCYLVDGKLYNRYGDKLMPLETDFNNQKLNVCWKVVGIRTDFVRITGNVILYNCPTLKKRLCRQDYSDGTCFYTLQDNDKPLNHSFSWNVNEGSKDIDEIIEYLNRHNAVDSKYLKSLPHLTTLINARNDLINFMKSLNQQTNT